MAMSTNQLDNIRKYIGAGENGPKLNRLGSKEWSNTKQRVKNNLRLTLGGIKLKCCLDGF